MRPPRAFPPLLAPILAAFFLAPSPAAGQLRPFSLELRGGLEAPVEELLDASATWAGDVGLGPTFSLDFIYSPSWHVGIYGGFGQHRFDCPPEGCGREADLVATGFDLGLRLFLGTARVVPWLRGGLVSYRVEGTVPSASGPRDVTSSRAYGVEGGVGLSVELSDRVDLVPGVRYVRMTPDFPGPGPLPMRYLIVDAGLVLGF